MKSIYLKEGKKNFDGFIDIKDHVEKGMTLLVS